MVRVDYICLDIEIHDAANDNLLKSENILFLRRSKVPSLDRVINADNPLVELEKLCIELDSEDKGYDMPFNLFAEIRHYHTAKQFLEVWDRLINSGAVTVKWIVRDEHRFHEEPQRRIPFYSSSSNAFIKLERGKK